ncbi:MAG: PDZ domain-containing protein, partial [Candidatus Gracilibacteria bacterium]
MYQYYPPKKHHYFLYPIAVVVSFILGWQATSYGILGGEISSEDVSGSEVTDDAGSSKLSDNIDMDLFWTVWGEVAKNYVDESVLNDEKMVYGSIKGMVDSLEDPYTVYMDPSETKDFKESLNGELEGIGAELSAKDKNLVIVSPLRNSPAEKAGLLPGDIIFKIDDKLASDMTLFDAIMGIRGEKGTTVKLTIIRKNVDE